MLLEHFIKRLNNIQKSNINFKYTLGTIPTSNEIEQLEQRLNIKIPSKILAFYLTTNGLITLDPNFEIKEINSWECESQFIHFATFNNSIRIYFDTAKLNEVSEWTIINRERNCIVTLSISSFWSNRIWHWLEHKRKIWEDDWWTNHY